MSLWTNPFKVVDECDGDDLSFPDHFGRLASIRFRAAVLLPPSEQRALIARPLQLFKAAAWFFAQRSPGCKRHREEVPPIFGYMRHEYTPVTRVRVMIGCVATVNQRLATAPASLRVTVRKKRSWE